MLDSHGDASEKPENGFVVWVKVSGAVRKLCFVLSAEACLFQLGESLCCSSVPLL